MGEGTCVWPKCRNRPEDADLPICDEHAERVHEHMARRLGGSREPGQYLLRPANPSGVVYYVRVGALVKVGFTTRLADRLAAYPPDAQLLAVEPGSKALEAQRHRELRHCLRKGREWYEPGREVTERIDAVLAEHGKPRVPNRRKTRHHEPVTVRRIEA